jgi:Spy/CpxP family protein refolding chaperone
MKTRLLVLAAIVATTLAGCGATLARVQANDQMSPTAQAAPGHHGRGGMLADLNLSADQKAQLKAIMQKARTSKGAPDKTARERFHALWSAPTLDQAALKALIQEHQAAGAKAREARVAALVEARNVLTPEQREKVATMLEARGAKMAGHQRPQGKRPHGQQTTLSAEQQAQLKALLEKRRGAGNRTAAFAAFARTGDTAGLAAAMAAPDLADDFVAFAATLTAEQRTKLERRVGMLAGFGGGMQRPHGRRNHKK